MITTRRFRRDAASWVMAYLMVLPAAVLVALAIFYPDVRTACVLVLVALGPAWGICLFQILTEKVRGESKT